MWDDVRLELPVTGIVVRFPDVVDNRSSRWCRSAHEPVQLSRPIERWPFGRTYVKATASSPDDPGEQCFLRAAEQARGSDAWRHREVDTNHMLLSNRPKEVVDLLLELS